MPVAFSPSVPRSQPAAKRVRSVAAPCPHAPPCARVASRAFRDFAAGLPDALYAFVIDRLTERREVGDVRTSVVYEDIRRAVLEPI